MNKSNKKMFLDDLYKEYPILKHIDEKNNGLVSEKMILRKLAADEYLNSAGEGCNGIIFVIKGTIKIQRINENGEETNLYNISQGELCHEALSCIVSSKSLNIIGKALQASEVGVFPLNLVKKFLLKDVDFLEVMYKDLYKKFASIIENKEERIHESLENRLINLLISKNSNVIYATHSQLAFEIDSAREVISRKLKSLEKRGYITITRGKIQINKNLKELIEK